MADENKLVDHLSKEIESHSNNLMTFRARINFAVFVGPFIVLGSLLVAAKGIPKGISIHAWTVIAFAGLAASYFTMGIACALIERHIWQQCNKWRQLILDITNNPEYAKNINKEELTFSESLVMGYMAVYTAMIVAFICVVAIIGNSSFSAS